MKLELSKEETTLLVKMLTMSAYITTYSSTSETDTGEYINNLVQKIYKEAQKDLLPNSFKQHQNKDTTILFPKGDIMSGENSPLHILKEYDIYIAEDILAHEIGMRDTSSKFNISLDNIANEPSEELMDYFIECKNKYLDEFKKNGFDNVKVTKE